MEKEWPKMFFEHHTQPQPWRRQLLALTRRLDRGIPKGYFYKHTLAFLRTAGRRWKKQHGRIAVECGSIDDPVVLQEQLVGRVWGEKQIA